MDGVPDSPPLLGFFRDVGNLKEAEMEKNLRNGLNIQGTDHLNHKQLDFGI